jgi:hypothetical protein
MCPPQYKYPFSGDAHIITLKLLGFKIFAYFCFIILRITY